MMLVHDIINTKRQDHETKEMFDAEFNYFAKEVDQDFGGYDTDETLEYDSYNCYD